MEIKHKLILKQWRNLRGLSQRDLAKKVGISDRTILNYERSLVSLRHASCSRIQLLAAALDVSPDNIFLDYSSEKQK